MPSNAFLLCRLWSKVQQWASTWRHMGHANHWRGASEYWRYNQRPRVKFPSLAVFQYHHGRRWQHACLREGHRATITERWSHPRDVPLHPQEETLWSWIARNPHCACSVQCTRLSSIVPVHIWHCRERVALGPTSHRHYLDCEGRDGEVLLWLKSQPTNTFQVLRQWGSSDGDRQRILLGVTSCKPARRQFWCDGRLLFTRSITVRYILPERQSSPVQGWHCSLQLEKESWKAYLKIACSTQSCWWTAIGWISTIRSRNKENKESHLQAEALHCFLECPHIAKQWQQSTKWKWNCNNVTVTKFKLASL